MISIRAISIDTLAAFKATRLAALKDTPLAFGSTFEQESKLTDADWSERISRWNGPRSVCYLAWDAATPCGIVAGLMDGQSSRSAHLVSMWVAPTHRRHGVGRPLVQAVLTWAAGKQVDRLYLSVTSVNETGLLFYEHLGFAKTGRTEPYPNAADIFEYEMVLPIGH